MLDISVTCDGSGPWAHCWFVRQNYNASINTSCDEIENNHKAISKNKCSFKITKWIRGNGAYSLVIIVDDGLNHIVKQVGINVYTGPR